MDEKKIILDEKTIKSAVKNRMSGVKCRIEEIEKEMTEMKKAFEVEHIENVRLRARKIMEHCMYICEYVRSIWTVRSFESD